MALIKKKYNNKDVLVSNELNYTEEFIEYLVDKFGFKKVTCNHSGVFYELILDSNKGSDCYLTISTGGTYVGLTIIYYSEDASVVELYKRLPAKFISHMQHHFDYAYVEEIERIISVSYVNKATVLNNFFMED